MSTYLPIAEVKNRLSEVVDSVQRTRERVVITKHGRPAAVVLNVDDLEGLEETLEIMSDPELMRQLRESEAERQRGELVRLTREELLAELDLGER